MDLVILFLGLSIMGDAMTTIKESPHIVELLKSLRNPFAAMMVGFVITAILQELICYGWYCYFDGVTGTSGIYNLSVFSVGL